MSLSIDGCAKKRRIKRWRGTAQHFKETQNRLEYCKRVVSSDRPLKIHRSGTQNRGKKRGKSVSSPPPLALDETLCRGVFDFRYQEKHAWRKSAVLLEGAVRLKAHLRDLFRFLDVTSCPASTLFGDGQYIRVDFSARVYHHQKWKKSEKRKNPASKIVIFAKMGKNRPKLEKRAPSNHCNFHAPSLLRSHLILAHNLL